MAEHRTVLEQEVRNLLKYFSTATTTQIVHQDDSQLRQKVSRVLNLWKPLSPLDIALVPDASLMELRDNARAVFQIFDDLAALQGDRPDAREKLVQELGRLTEKIYRSLGPALLLIQQPSSERERLRHVADEYRRTSDEQAAHAARLLEELQQIKERARSRRPRKRALRGTASSSRRSPRSTGWLECAG